MSKSLYRIIPIEVSGLILGLTGGIAAGKSTVAKMLAEVGAVILDCDIIAASLVQPGSHHWANVLTTFGKSFVRDDGGIDRGELGKKVFSDETQLHTLNAILHPPLVDEVRSRLYGTRNHLVVIDAAVLIESGLYKECDHVCLVVASEAIRLRRLMERNKLSEEDARTRMQRQRSLKTTWPYCDICVDTSLGLDDTRKQVAYIQQVINVGRTT